MTLDQIDRAIKAVHLSNAGAFHGEKGDGFGTLILLAPGPEFWQNFTRDPEYQDNQPDPVDRWSLRVIEELANDLGGTAQFPFGGPPYTSFLDYAQKSKSAFSSKVGMLVHHQYGLMISYRGALCFDQRIHLPDCKISHPCETCVEQPCLTACPVDAINDGKYDVRVCKSHLGTQKGKECLQDGCKIRTVCPLSVRANREKAQSEYHMRRFLKG